MNIMTEEQHRALAFVQAANEGGYEPTDQDVEAWLTSPTPQSSILGGGLLRYTRLGLGLESTTSHLSELGWLESDPLHNRLKISVLGRALLRSHESKPDSDDTVLIADNRDPLAYPRLMGALTNVGPGLLVDPYLDAEGLLDIAEHTQLERVLVGQKDRGKTTRLKMTLKNSAISTKVEVRASGEVHDRMVVSTAGEVWLIGASLNTVSRRSSFTTLTPLPPEAAAVLRARVEGCWSEAPSLLPLDEESDAESTDSSTSPM